MSARRSAARSRAKWRAAADTAPLRHYWRRPATCSPDYRAAQASYWFERQSKTLKQIEFVNLGPGKALVILVGDDGDVENRIISLPDGLPLSSLNAAANYVNARIGGLTLADARTRIETEIEQRRAQLDELTAQVVTDGPAT